MTNQTENTGQNPYKFTVKGVTFDFYDLSDAISFKQAAVEHAVKKLVALGSRSGNKSYSQDLHEAIMSLLRAQEQYNESLRSTEGAVRERTGEEAPQIIAPLYNYDPRPTVCKSGDAVRSSETKEKDYYSCSRGGSPDDGIEEAFRALEAWAETFNKGL